METYLTVEKLREMKSSLALTSEDYCRGVMLHNDLGVFICDDRFTGQFDETYQECPIFVELNYIDEHGGWNPIDTDYTTLEDSKTDELAVDYVNQRIDMEIRNQLRDTKTK